jgi:YD repeat-containing protein
MHQTCSETRSRSINNLNRVASVSLGNPPDVVATAFGFDANGQTIGSSDGLGQGNAQTLDALRRPVASTLPDGSQARVAYNALDQITSATDPKGIRTSYLKNAWGETLSETSPDSGITSYGRDAAGNVLAMTDARGQTARYSYDALNRLTQVTRADGQLQRYSYDTPVSVSNTCLSWLRVLRLNVSCDMASDSVLSCNSISCLAKSWCVAAIERICTKARMISILIAMARGLFNTDDSIATPCSVNA